MAEAEPILDAAEIQGNILGGFNQDHQAILPMWFGANTAQTKTWLSALIPHLAWLPEIHGHRTALKTAIALTGAEPADLHALWVNVSFSWTGLSKLTDQVSAFNGVFKGGLPAATGRIGDPITQGVAGEAHGWLFGGPGDVPDALVIVAGDIASVVSAKVAEIIAAAQTQGLTVRGEEFGHNLASFGRPDLDGHEHFGFKDGVSQPGVRGLVTAKADDWLTPRPADQNPQSTEVEYSTTGDPLLWVGEFVLGYRRQAGTNGRASADPYPLGSRSDSVVTAGAVAPWWAANGSFLVYRRLRQDVAAFNDFVAATVIKLRKTAEFAAIDNDRLGAMLVGRWTSGAPLLLSQAHDDPVLGADCSRNNSFGFDSIDLLGGVCPQAAHIRKVNPRDIDTDDGPPSHTLNHRILRRGIAYGAPLAKGAVVPDDVDRGLLFLCYQASIGDQFEFLATKWVGDTANPNEGLAPDPGYGIDPIIGQRRETSARYIVVGASHVHVDLPVSPWITATGGGYFFTPSRQALTEVLTV
jgi:Dyp-type peroxidase family